MRLIRQHAGGLAAIAVLWQLSAIAAASTALSCSGTPAAPPRTAAAAHENMADCPMRKSEPSCPLHADKHGTHDCDCPTMGCAETDPGFLALFGTVGILPAIGTLDAPSQSGDAGPVMTLAAIRLAVVPLSPPPRI